jgi:IS30 family transposase
VVNFRGRFGDCQADTVEDAKGTGLIATHAERKRHYTKLGKRADKRADTLVASTCAIFRGMPPSLRRTSTLDNGREFAAFKRIEDTLGMTIYFANPHAPWERGANENTNGLLRDDFPKRSDFIQITPARRAQVEKRLNHRPRKCRSAVSASCVQLAWQHGKARSLQADVIDGPQTTHPPTTFRMDLLRLGQRGE